MDMADIRKKAKDAGIKTAVGMKKLELIRAIQAKEGNFPCFGTADDYCDQLSCLYREDCLAKKYTA